MKITELKISPARSWDRIGDNNPLRAVVKLASEKSTVETIIPEHMMDPLMKMVAGIVAQAARDNVAEFAAAVTALDADQGPLLADE